MLSRRAFNLLLRGGSGALIGGGGVARCVSADQQPSVGVIDEKRPAQIVHDIGIIGGGIVGLAVAREFKLRYPDKSMILLEKEDELASAQTGHNSGVIHAGMYYKPGSMKATLCVQGAKLTYDYCTSKNIPFKQVGKLIVAVHEDEIANLKVIYKRALENKVVGVQWLDSPAEIREIEPHCVGLRAVHCSSTGIVDWKQVARAYATDFTEAHGIIRLNHSVVDIQLQEQKQMASQNSKLSTTTDDDLNNSPKIGKERREDCRQIALLSKDQPPVHVRHLVTCSGIYSDRVSAMTGGDSLPKMIPFRGEYLLLKSDKTHLIRGNIYPVPNPNFPFLGVHFTPRLNGDVWLGPNAILGFSREGYSYTDINLSDLLEILTFSGMIKIAMKHGMFGVSEIYKSLVLSAQVKELQKYVPELTIEDVTRGPSGVRAQAVGSDGTLVEDFIFDETQQNILHVRNAPSPGATSSLAIGKLIVDKAEVLFDLANMKKKDE